jgi:hypothetical protein
MLSSPVGISDDFFEGYSDQLERGETAEAIAWTAASLTPTVVFASDLESDTKAAEQIRAGFHQATMVGLKDVPHAVSWPLAQRGMLRYLFDQILGKR